MAKYPITITAIDQTTAVVRKVKAQFASFTAPVTRLQTSLKTLSKEAGLDRLQKSAINVGKSFGAAAKGAADFLPELGGMGRLIGSAGKGGGVAGGIAALAAGVGVLTVKWADFGFNVKQASISLGLGAQQLQAWRGAASMMGIDVHALDGTMQSLGDTIEDAISGRNNEALAVMGRLGIALKRTKSGAIDVNDELLQISDVMKKFQGQPEKQRLIARIFGIDPQMLTLLRGGRAELEQYLKTGGRFALSDKEIDDANKLDLFIKKWTTLGKGAIWKGISSVIEGIGASRDFFNGPNAWITDLAPMLRALWEGLVKVFREVERLIGSIQKKMDDLIPKPAAAAAGVVGKIIDAVTNPGKVVGAAIGAIVGGGLPKGDGLSSVGRAVTQFMIAHGIRADRALGIGAGVTAEGGTANAFNAAGGGHGAFGIGQWRGARQRALFAKYGPHPTLQQQMEFLFAELSGGDPGGRSVLSGGSAADTGTRYLRDFMRPGGGLGGDLHRMNSALGPGHVKVDVKVTHNGHGASVKTAATGNVSARGRVEQSLAGAPA